MVIDEAAKYREEIPEDWKLAFMYGSLLHDVGKPLVTKWDNSKKKITSIGHEEAGEPVARKFMERLTNNEDLINKVCSIVKLHMKPKVLINTSIGKAKWRRLQNECPLNILAYVSMVDTNGRGNKDKYKGKEEESFINTIRIHNELGSPKKQIKPILMGRHLINAGLKPSTLFSTMLKKAYEYQIETGIEDISKLLEVAQDV